MAPTNLVDLEFGCIFAAKADDLQSGVRPDGRGLLENERDPVNDEQPDLLPVVFAHSREDHRRNQGLTRTRRHH